MIEKLEWHVERIAWRDMIPYEHNPRKMYFIELYIFNRPNNKIYLDYYSVY